MGDGDGGKVGDGTGDGVDVAVEGAAVDVAGGTVAVGKTVGVAGAAAIVVIFSLVGSAVTSVTVVGHCK